MKKTNNGVRKNILLMFILVIFYLVCTWVISLSMYTLIPIYQFIGNATYALICGAALYAFDTSSKKNNFYLVTFFIASSIWVMKNAYVADNNFQFVYIVMTGYLLLKQVSE